MASKVTKNASILRSCRPNQRGGGGTRAGKGRASLARLPALNEGLTPTERLRQHLDTKSAGSSAGSSQVWNKTSKIAPISSTASVARGPANGKAEGQSPPASLNPHAPLPGVAPQMAPLPMWPHTGRLTAFDMITHLSRYNRKRAHGQQCLPEGSALAAPVPPPALARPLDDDGAPDLPTPAEPRGPAEVLTIVDYSPQQEETLARAQDLANNRHGDVEPLPVEVTLPQNLGGDKDAQSTKEAELQKALADKRDRRRHCAARVIQAAYWGHRRRAHDRRSRERQVAAGAARVIQAAARRLLARKRDTQRRKEALAGGCDAAQREIRDRDAAVKAKQAAAARAKKAKRDRKKKQADHAGQADMDDRTRRLLKLGMQVFGGVGPADEPGEHDSLAKSRWRMVLSRLKNESRGDYGWRLGKMCLGHEDETFAGDCVSYLFSEDRPDSHSSTDGKATLDGEAL